MIAYLLLLFRHLVPALVHLQVNSIGLELLVRAKGSLEILPDNGSRSLRVQERGGQRLLGSIGILLLLLALALGPLDRLAGFSGSFGLVAPSMETLIAARAVAGMGGGG